MTIQSKHKRVLIISGEASGDQHGAKLVSEVLKLDANIHFFGIGGRHMREAGVDTVVDSTQMAVIGAIEILFHFKYIFRAWKKMREIIKKQPPDLVIVIDYPEFNLQIAKMAKRAGIKVLYYISPQIWAWKQGRIKTIRKRIDKMLVIFPFEEEFYTREHVPVEFVGHPLTDHAHATMNKQQALSYFNIPENKRIIGLLPGSRKGEIVRLLPVILKAAQLLQQYYENLTFILPLASSLSDDILKPYLESINLEINITTDHFYDAMQLCEAAVVTSGTATLQTALIGVPMVIIYKITALTYFMAKRVIKIPFIGLCNIVAGKSIVKELIQQQANPQAIFTEISKLLDDKAYREQIISELNTVKAKLGKSGGSLQAAQAVLKLLYQ